MERIPTSGEVVATGTARLRGSLASPTNESLLAIEIPGISEERQRLAVDAGNVGLWDWDIVTGQLTWSDRVYEFHGIAPASFKGTVEEFERLLHPDDAQRVLESLRRTLEEDAEYNLEFRTVRPDGQTRWLATRARVLRDQQGRPNRMLGATLDVTERKVAEGALKESERFTRSILESSRDCIKILNTDGCLVSINAFGQEALGIANISGYLNRSYIDFWEGAEREACEKAVNAARAGGTGSFEGCFGRLNREPRWWHVQITPISDDEGGVKQLLAISRDITTTKQAEERLRRSNAALRDSEEQLRGTLQRFGAVISASPLPIVALTREGNVTLWNPAAERVFGWTSEEVMSKPLPFIPADKQDEHRQMRARDLSGQGFTDREIRRRRKDGSPVDLRVSTAPLTNETGHVVGIMSVYADVTERKRLEHELVESEAKFRALVEQSPMPTQVISMDGGIVRGNRAWERLFGVTVEQITDFNAFSDPQLAQRGILPYLLRARGGEAVELPELPFVPDRGERQGEVLWVRSAAYPVRDEAGAVREIVLVQEDVTERRRAKEELRHTAQRFSMALKNSPVSVFEQDKELRYTWAHNEHPLFRPEVLVGKADWELNPGPWWNDITPVKRRILESGVGERHEFVIPVHGQPATYDMTLEPLRDELGEILGITGSAVDITALKRVESDLRLREEQYRFLTDALPQIVWVANGSGDTELLNLHWYEYTGTSREQTLAEVWSKVIHPDDLETSLERWRRACEHSQPYEVEYRLKRACDQSYRWHLARMSPVRNERGEVLKWIGVALDIHDRREAVTALRVSEERFRTIVEAAAEGIWIVDANSRTTFTNLRMTELLGYRPEEMLGRSYFEFLHPDETERAKRSFQNRRDFGDTAAREYRF
ncbi:MAG TPA: PAS domain S-box protein, partial [Bryobacteraceae bacterium]|nr:PAS domain S-box protein [Bryobacteraceae bacterium]